MPTTSRERAIDSLIIDGDWACASADRESLGRVCRRVGEVDRELASQASEVARWASRDLFVALTHWSELAAALRRRLSAGARDGSSSGAWT